MNVLFRIEKYELFEKLIAKLINFERYCEEKGIYTNIEIVCAGDVVKRFANLDNELVGKDYDVALCHNALSGCGMEDINYLNVRTVSAGIGEIIERKFEGYVEYTIE